MTITRVDLALAAGETVRIQGGNQLFLYSLSGASSLGFVFYHPNGQRMGPEGEFPAGVRYGPGQSRPNGAPYWQWAEVTNNSASAVTAVLFIAESVVDLSAVAPSVTITSGEVDADVMAGERAGAWADAKTGPGSAAWNEATDFHVMRRSTGLTASSGQDAIHFYVANGGGATYPKAVLIEELFVSCASDDWELYLSDNVAFGASPSGSPIGPTSFITEHGTGSELFPSSAGSGSRNWMRHYASWAPSSFGVMVAAGVDKSMQRIKLRRPVVCEFVTGANYSSRAVTLKNLSGSASGVYSIGVRGKVIAS